MKKTFQLAISALLVIAIIIFVAGCSSNPVVLSCLKIENKPVTEYIEGQSISLEGMVVFAEYSDDTRHIVDNSELELSIQRPLKCTDTFFTVTYQGCESEKINITVQAKVLQSISIEEEPDKTYYSIGDKLSSKGLAIKAKYNSGDEIVTSGYTLSPVEGTVFTSYGSKEITVAYGGKTASIGVEVDTYTIQPGKTWSDSVFVKSNITSIVFQKDEPETYDSVWNIDISQTGKVKAYLCDSGKTIKVAGNRIVANENTKDMFLGFVNAETIDIGMLETFKAEDMSYMFYNCNTVKILNTGNFDTSNVTTMKMMLYECNNLETLDIDFKKNPGKFNTSKVKDMFAMFSGCQKLKALDVSGFDTQNVTNMRMMFSGCETLQSLDVSKFNTSKTELMGSMFNLCRNITSLDVTCFDTSNVTDMYGMFSNCEKLTALDLSSFNTNAVDKMTNMFKDCKALEYLTLTDLETSNVIDMMEMFKGCSKISKLDLSSFDTSSLVDARSMFEGCSSLETIYASSWNTGDDLISFSDKMFSGCKNIMGELGTLYNENNTDKAYAVIDEGLSKPGYFTSRTK